VKRRGVFLDRDGVINRYLPGSVRREEEFEYEAGAAAALRLLGALGAPIVVVTNQSAIGRGTTTPATVDAIHARLRADAERWGGPIAAIEICPHAPEARCECRKPGTALFHRAAERLGISLEGSFCVGDAPSDVEASRRLGLRAVRVRTGRGSEPLPPGLAAEATVDDILAAARWIAARCEEGENESRRAPG
jgi:D-glycero-D-manno-heptose 1,7-bisphosphate phosphatase